MKLSCLQDNLNRALGIVGRAVATRTTLPITQNVLLATDQGRLKLSATNLEIAITTWIGGKVEEEGALTVPARLLIEFVNALPGEQIDITATQRPKALQLKCARYEARINGTDAGDFPPLPSVEDGVPARLDPQALRAAVRQVVFAAATEESRPVLTGIKVEMEGDRFTMAAADGFRLAVHKGSLLEPVSQPIGVIVPARTFAELERLLGDQQEPVEVLVTPAKSQALFRLKNVEMISQLVQGNFPNYGQLIPQNHQTRTVVDLQEFLRAVKTASIFARDGSGIVRFQMTPGADGAGKLAISARAEEVGENMGELDAKIEGEPAKIAFSSKYLLDVLNVLGEGEVALESTSPSSPGVFKPVVAAKQGKSKGAPATEYVHVVMPMFVQW